MLNQGSSLTHLGGHGTMIGHWPLGFGTRWQQLHCIPHHHSTSVHNWMSILCIKECVGQ
jgi:hypothetical protein